MDLTVRPARPEDAEVLGRMGAALARHHHAIDPARFMLPEDLESGYAWWLGKELAEPRAVVVVAESEGRIVGYAYGRLEGRDWNLLLDRHAALHDVWVDPDARARGAGGALVDAVVRRLEALGAPRVLLSTAKQNETAQRLFAKLGFRATMIEMTRERTSDDAPA